jgi:hypothetical protein
MAQAGLEKLYYWIFKAEKTSQRDSPKLRILIKYLNIEQQALLRFNNLKGFYKNIENRNTEILLEPHSDDIIHPKKHF